MVVFFFFFKGDILKTNLKSAFKREKNPIHGKGVCTSVYAYKFFECFPIATGNSKMDVSFYINSARML